MRVPSLLLGMCLVGAVPAVVSAAEETKPADTEKKISVRQVTNLLREYNAKEAKLEKMVESSKEDATLPVPELVQHWNKLKAVRSKLEKLEKAGTLKRMSEQARIPLRHEIAKLLGRGGAIAEVQGELDVAELEQADHDRKQNLLSIANLVNRSLDFMVREVAGIAVEGMPQ